MTHASVHLSLDFQWQLIGHLQRDENGGLLFPEAPYAPGLYRFRLCGSSDAHHYVGETDNLRRRFRHYRKPGPTQKTNQRIRKVLCDHIAEGGDVNVDFATEISVLNAETLLRVDLSDKAVRRLLEYGAQIAEADVGVKLLNR